MKIIRYSRAGLCLLYMALSSMPLLVQAASTEASFTPESIVIPIREIGFKNSVTGVNQPLYECAGTSESECLVDVTDEAALGVLFAAPSAIDPGSYDQLYVANCINEGGYSARISGAANIAGVTYYTAETAMSSDPLSTNVAMKGSTVVDFQGCVRSYQLPDSVTVSSGTPINLSLFVANTNIAWARLGAKTIPSGCIENTSQTQSVCLAYPDIMPYIGSSNPYLENYFITEKASSNELGGQILLVIDRDTDAVLAGFTRRYFSKTSKSLSVNFDTPLKTVTKLTGNRYLLENYGSSADSFYVRFADFIRQTHVANYVTDTSASITYQAYKSDADAVVPDMIIPLPIKNATIDSDSIAIVTGGGTVHASIGPFGAHFSPLTGHLWGDGKANFMAYLARSDAELKPYVDNNTNGICDSGDQCGFDGGINGINITAMQPTYIAPADGVITSIVLESLSGSSSLYLNGQPKWRISLQIGNRYSIDFGHVGSIATALKDKISSATGINIDSVTMTGEILPSGTTIMVNQGDELAHPQLVASEISGHTGFYQGGAASDKYPWAQMEYFIVDHMFGHEVCQYDLLSDTDKTSLNTAMINDMSDAQSPRYGFSHQDATDVWKWRAEAVPCTAYTTGSFSDFSSIHARLGGWVERNSTSVPPVIRDELFAIVPIQTTSALYNAANYQPGVTHLVSRARIAAVNNFNWVMPGGGTPTDIYYPVGEVLEESANSLLIMWRDFSASHPAPVYQRAAFQLDSDGLKIKWGDFSDSVGAAVAPVLGTDDCNDTNVICYDHQQNL